MDESEEIKRKQAAIYFDKAHRLQMRGELADAIINYKRSLATFPTSEAYTYLGWTYSMMQRYEEAIEVCEKAIELDPSLGSPLNDIGAYLIEMKRWEEAIPWLEKALTAPSYETPQFAHLNLGRVYEQQGELPRALEQYDLAMELDPFYRAAHGAKYALLAKLN